MPEIRSLMHSMGTDSSESGTVSIGTFRGREFTIVPVVGLVQNVIQGLNAEEPEFAPADEFAKFPASWNGRPITLNHPRYNGELVSANDPMILEEYSFGFLANSTRDGTKLKFEAWVDNALVADKGGDFQEMLDRLTTMAESGDIVEVSTGLFTEVIEQPGVYNGRKYKRRWSGVAPDHLAFLPKGTIGACSVEDGCGAPRLNMRGLCLEAKDPAKVGEACCDACAKGEDCMATNGTAGEGDETPGTTVDNNTESGDGDVHAPDESQPTDEDTTGTEPVVSTDVPLTTEMIEANAAAVATFDRLVTNSIPSGMTHDNVRNILQGAVSEAYGSDMGYCYIVAVTSEQVAFEVYGCCGYDNYGCVAVNYSITDSGGVSFTGEPAPVNLLVSIVPRVTVDLAANEGVTEEEGDPGANQQHEEGNMPDTPEADGNVQTNGAGAPPAPVTVEAFLQSAPPEIALVLNEGIAMRTQRKAKLVADIRSNSQAFSEEDLNAKDIPELEKLLSMSKPADDYSGRAIPRFFNPNSAGNDEVELSANQRTVPEAPLAFERKPRATSGMAA